MLDYVMKKKSPRQRLEVLIRFLLTKKSLLPSSKLKMIKPVFKKMNYKKEKLFVY